MTEYNFEICTPDETTTRVLVKTVGFRWSMKKECRVTRRGVAKSSQPSQGGTGTPAVGISDTLKMSESFTLTGYLDSKADANGSTTTRETKRDNLRTILRNGQCFKLKWTDVDGTAQSFSVNLNGEITVEQSGEDIHRLKVTIPLIAGTNWGAG